MQKMKVQPSRQVKLNPKRKIKNVLDGVFLRCRSSPKISQRAVLSYHSDELLSKHDTVMFTIFYLRNYLVDRFQIFLDIVLNNLLSDKKISLTC